MKMLTEFSTLTLRKAATARAAAGGATGGASAAELDDAMDASEAAAHEQAGDASMEPSASEAPEAHAEPEASEAPADGASVAAPVETKPDPIIDAIAAALAVPPDRAARLLEAIDIIGNRLEEVRLVRVFQGEQGPHGSIARGEFHYAI